MPLYREDLANRLPRTLITGSVAVEIEWALATVQRSDFKRDHPVLERVYSQHPELVERARSFWGPGQLPGDGGSIELIVLAHHGGLLACVDPEEFLGRLEALCATAPVPTAGLPIQFVPTMAQIDGDGQSIPKMSMRSLDRRARTRL